MVADPIDNSLQVLRVKYPAGSFKPSGPIPGGFGVYAEPKNVFPCNTVKLSYQLFFDGSFDPVKGGKLPGLYIGSPGASGGKHSKDQASCRLMWRAYNKKLPDQIMAEAYTYVPQPQDPSYNKIPSSIYNPEFGDSLWRGLLNFKKGSWNQVVSILTLNTFNSDGSPKADGKLLLKVNGISQEFNNFIWATDKSILIRGITTDTFFGGGDNSFATPKDTYIYFKDFILN
jgi:hypothetical protein